MNGFPTYLLKVSVATMLLYLFYLLFFSKETFYIRNRIYLIITMSLPIIIPLVTFPGFLKDRFILSQPAHFEGSFKAYLTDTSFLAQAVTFSFHTVFLWVYFSVSIFLLLRLITGLIRTFKIIGEGEIIDEKFPRVVISEMEHPVFSFFPYVVIPKSVLKDEGNHDILKHEKTHVRQGHTMDIILAEMLIAFQWFNPVVYFVRRSLVLNHEYLADNSLIRNSADIKTYQYRLLTVHSKFQITNLVHSFSSQIKNRLVMMNKKPTSSYATMKNILILPAIVLLFALFAFKPGSIEFQPENSDLPISKSSESTILDFLQRNIVYPAEAMKSSDTGRIYVVVNMNKGGIVKSCSVSTSTSGCNAPFIREIVIAGYKSSVNGISAPVPKNHPALKAECFRVANMLGEVNIPEWTSGDVEFALAFHFILQ